MIFRRFLSKSIKHHVQYGSFSFEVFLNSSNIAYKAFSNKNENYLFLAVKLALDSGVLTLFFYFILKHTDLNSLYKKKLFIKK